VYTPLSFAEISSRPAQRRQYCNGLRAGGPRNGSWTCGRSVRIPCSLCHFRLAVGPKGNRGLSPRGWSGRGVRLTTLKLRSVCTAILPWLHCLYPSLTSCVCVCVRVQTRTSSVFTFKIKVKFQVITAGGYEEYCLLGFNGTYFGDCATFRRKISPPFSGPKSKPSRDRRQAELRNTNQKCHPRDTNECA
jgi:hypothetical protein